MVDPLEDERILKNVIPSCFTKDEAPEGCKGSEALNEMFVLV